MKINKKGFTVVELLASFSLTMIIVVFLFEILIELKDLYSEASVKTEIVQKQSLLVNKIRKTLDTNDLAGVTCASDTCTFNFNDISPVVLKIDASTNTVVFNDEKTKFPSEVSFKSYGIETCPISSGKPTNDLGMLDGINAKNCYFSFDLFLESARLEEDYPIKIVYPFNYTENFVSGNLSYETGNEGSKTILNCKNDEYVYNVEKTGTYKIELLGASGGDAGTLKGGKGAYTSGEIYLTSGEKLYFNVGCQGSKLSGGVSASTKGGYNGGGDGTTSSVGVSYSGGGGGATDVRYNGNSLSDRIMVAGGGSGAGNGSSAKAGSPGGSLIAQNSENGVKGATQIDGGKTGENPGSFGIGANAVTLGSGGGGGYYGGSGGTSSGSTGTSGSGGSSYISGYVGSNAVTTSITPSNVSNHYSGKVFYNATMYSGDKVPSDKTSEEIYSQMAEELKSPGDGYAIITYEKSSIPDEAKSKAVSSANYDLSNAILWFDGIDNDGSGIHNYKIDSWRDAVSAKTLNLTGANWSKNGLDLSAKGVVDVNASAKFSISLVFSLSSFPSSNTYLIEGKRGVFITSSGNVGFSNGTEAVTFDYQIPLLNVKNYILISSNGAKATLYVNGKSMSTKDITTTTSSSERLSLKGALSGSLNKFMLYNDEMEEQMAKSIYDEDYQRFSPVKNNLENEKVEYGFKSGLYDENDNTVSDMVNNKLTGKIVGQMEITNDALKLNGSNYIELSGDVNYRYSIILALKADSYNGDNPYLTGNSTYPSIYLNSTSGYKYAFNAQGVNSNFNNTYTNGKLEYIVVTYDGSKIRLYLDGNEKSSLTVSEDPASTEKAYIGKNFVGKIYKYALVDRTLTSEEIKEIYEYDALEFN